MTTLTYCHNGDVAQTLDLYGPPDTSEEPRPLAVYVHGGGWQGGTARISPGLLVGRVESTLVARGWAFASIEYRLAPRYRWPAQIEDAKCAVRFLRSHAASLRIRASRIGAVGDSAGGQLVSLLGLAGPSAGWDGDTDRHVSSAVQAVIDLYGPSDLNAMEWRLPVVGREVSSAVFGVPAGEPSPVLAAASPLSHVDDAAPPFLVIQGEDDRLVVPSQSRELVGRLRAAGASATLVMVAHAKHGLAASGNGSPQPSIDNLAQTAVRFLVAHVARQPF